MTSLRRDIGNIVHCEIFGLSRARYSEREIVPLQNCRHGHVDCGTLELFLKNFRFVQHRPPAGHLDIEHSHSLKANERYLLYNVYVKGLESGVEEMTGLPKEKESSEPLSFPSTREAVMRSHEMDGPSLSEGRDRKLRNQLILANVIAWIAIGLAVRYFFF